MMKSKGKRVPITFDKENEFEDSIINLLIEHGWETKILMYQTEEDLIKNWANILFENNKSKDKLDQYPLTDSEIQQVLSKVALCGNPYELNRFINGELVSIIRDNPADKEHLGKEIYLKIFDAKEIAAGQSRYQIARQPKFKSSLPLAGNRRGDFMLLINGMPVIHVELKRSKVDVSQAIYQIKRYTHEGIFDHGIFSLIQVFVAMTPEETIYFANPGSEDKFNKDYQFHWEDFNNLPENNWALIASDLLSIPMAHQLVGYYTIADEKDKTLKVLRSYQYFAVSKICDVVHQTIWDDNQHKGGYIWHTTGSGKTMTSFKAAQLIANSNDADKVVFVMDRIELGAQSLDEYRGFAGESDTVQDTDDTDILLTKLNSTSNDEKLIVTSIQKMSRINAKSPKISEQNIRSIGNKRLVFILDECHRSVFGTMLISIKNTFPRAILFGFTGTPIFKENAKKEITTETLFGNELHRYSISNGIIDKNVLGFDVYKVETYEEKEIRKIVALEQSKSQSITEAMQDEDKKKKYLYWMNEAKMPISYSENGISKKGVEFYLPKSQYRTKNHHEAVVNNIIHNWETLSLSGKFHAILTTKNIPEAIAYYNLMKEMCPHIKVVAIFDNSIDNVEGAIYKEDAILQMIADYNLRYGINFEQSSYDKYKKDVQLRLAHKKTYIGIEENPAMQIDILIVVTQMLTGYDSKWVNTMYVDKLMKNQDIIQAFSRTNRLFGHDKPFGIIKYYTFPHTMEQNINAAVKAYSGNRPYGLFVDHLEQNLHFINNKFEEIQFIFSSAGIDNFARLPESKIDRNKFAVDFNRLSHLIEAAKLQGFTWNKLDYRFEKRDIHVALDQETYMILVQRYRELFEGTSSNGGGEDVPYPIETYITETGTGTIDAEYMNSKFQQFVKRLYTEGPGSENTKAAVRELHKTFAKLSQEDQKTAILILHDIQRGDIHLESGKTIQDYIVTYQKQEVNNHINILSNAIGVNTDMLQKIIKANVSEDNLNEFNRFENLKNSVDKSKSKDFLERIEKKPVKPRMVMAKIDKILRNFILSDKERIQIIKLYLENSNNINLSIAQTADEMFYNLIENKKEDTEIVAQDAISTLKEKIKENLESFFINFKSYMRPSEEIINSVFFVLRTESISTLDGVDEHIMYAFNKIFNSENINIVEKHVAFNLLVTKFEAYLKKLFYIIHNEEIKTESSYGKATFKNAIHAFSCLWELKNSQKPEYQLLYKYLMMVKSWRNNESHISPTATEEELTSSINIITILYFFTTGSNITELEMAGYDVNENNDLIISDYEFRNTSKKEFYIPFYSIRAACGHFLYNEEPTIEGWIKAEKFGINHNDPNYFIVKACGHSMEPDINDGDLCLFQANYAGSREGKNVLFEIPERDTEYGGSFTIKQYHHIQKVDDNGRMVNTSIQLIPKNKEYDVMNFKAENDLGIKDPIGVFISKI